MIQLLSLIAATFPVILPFSEAILYFTYCLLQYLLAHTTKEWTEQVHFSTH